MPTPRLSATVATVLAVLSGCLLSEAYALHPLWWAAWLAPMPVLAAALADPARAWRMGALCGLIAGASTLSYYVARLGWPGTLLIVAARALFWGGGTLLAVGAARRFATPLAVLALPLFATGLETLVLTLSPHGAAGSLAYSQLALPALVQVAALGGVPAIVFVVTCGGSLGGFVLARLIGAGPSWPSLRRAALPVAAVLLGTAGFSAMRLAHAAATQTVDAALVTTDQFAGEPTDWATVWAAYGPAVAQAARPGSVVVLPEKIARLADASVAAAQLAGLARSHQATLVAGVETRDTAGHWVNRALLALPDGFVQTYDKQHLVPGFEDRDAPGTTKLLAALNGVRTGLAICKDMHFPQLGRDYGQAGARLMLVPAWDFGVDGWMSDRLTVLRGIESGFAIARSTRNGVSSISDRTGRIVAAATGTEQVTVVRAAIPIDPAATLTLYDTIGDSFGWACLIATILLIAVRRGRLPFAALPAPLLAR